MGSKVLTVRFCIFRYYYECADGFKGAHCEILCVFSGTTVSVLMGSNVLTVRFCVYFQVLL